MQQALDSLLSSGDLRLCDEGASSAATFPFPSLTITFTPLCFLFPEEGEESERDGCIPILFPSLSQSGAQIQEVDPRECCKVPLRRSGWSRGHCGISVIFCA